MGPNLSVYINPTSPECAYIKPRFTKSDIVRQLLGGYYAILMANFGLCLLFHVLGLRELSLFFAYIVFFPFLLPYL